MDASTVCLALGGNLGPVEANFRSALEGLRQAGLTTERVSAVHRSRPVGSRAGAEFLNAAAVIRCPLEPLELLDLLQRIEDEHGRQRGARWGPRPLDLDVLFIGESVIDTPRLTVPHPDCWYRRFVLDPLAEVAPDWPHPTRGRTVAELRQRLLVRPLPVSLHGGDTETRAAATRAMDEAGEAVSIAATPETAALALWLGPEDAASDAAAAWDALPTTNRLDLTRFGDDIGQATRDVLRAALG
jgi:2-amino-4-hydroxy-6-hydroxymethyldihydropteridine diphosphokinase